MGADIQAQAHVQVVSHLIDLGGDIQSAIDAPRFFYLGGKRVALEAPLVSSAGEALAAKGHEVAGPEEVPFPLSFGAGQGVMRDVETGSWLGGSDSRKDGFALGE
jgi:gamma-glutamyltranspeptidase/glutathione hydrolase